uniref:Uncharacterized protein n=1 Tax=Alexandrium catenella TaxID=2925 RepID=A0A7S1WTE5_ALECA
MAQSPVQQVIQMLTDMKAKGEKEKEVESQIFKTYESDVYLEWKRELEYQIKSEKAQIEELTATIGKHDSDVQELGGQIREIDGQVDTLETDQKAAAQMRERERSEFLEEQTSYTESLYALDRAIQMLKAQSYDREQATAFLQRTAKTLPGMRRVLAALELLEMGAHTADQQPSGAPAVAAYEFQSGSIVDMLKELRKKFKDELGELQKEEMNMAHAYSMQDLHSRNTVSSLKSQGEALTESKLRISADLASAKDELAKTKKSFADAEKLLAETTATYRTKKAIYEENQKVRAEEVQAIAKAIEIMSSPELLDSYAQHVKSLVQVPAKALQERRPATFLQVHSASGRAAERSHAAKFLRGRARELRSEVLDSLAQQMAENPFAKVIDLMKSLLARLKEEAASEADHKAFCDEELRANKLKREKTSSAASRLHAEIEEKAMAIAKMAKQIAALAQEQASLRKVMAEATSERQKEKAANQEAIEDSAAGQVALDKAIAVLQEFYSRQGGALLQVSHGRQVPKMEAYGGMLGETGGVVGMLEVIKSDFSRVEAETRAAEVQAAQEYKELASDAEAELKSKHDSEFQLGLKKDQAEFEKGQLRKDLDATQEQLEMANKYYEELKPQCVTVHVTYEERAAKRQEEVKALQEAYRILEGKSAAL